MQRRRLSAWLVFSLIATAFVSTATAADEAGWVSLFDGKSLDGWESLPLPNQPPSKWEVIDGTIVGTGGASMLFSPKGEYTNF